MRKYNLVGLIILILLIFYLNSHPIVKAENEPELLIESEFRFLFGNGGGNIKITIQGDLAEELREDIIRNYILKTNNTNIEIPENSKISEVNQKDYSEAIEDILEMNINLENEWRDKDPGEAGVDYNGQYKLMKFDSEVNRVDVRTIKGLIGTGVNDSSKITISIDVKESPVENKEIILNDGYIILYALLGEKILPTHLDVKEKCNIITIGSESYNNPDLKCGGKITHYRLLLGEYYEYEHEYGLNGYELSDDKKDSIKFESFNVLENSLVLFLIILIFSIIPSLYSSNLVKKSRIRKVMLLKIIGFIFFLILIIFYFLGIFNIAIWFLTFIFFIINSVIAFGVYRRGWGNLTEKAVRREDFLKEPPKIEQGPWHQRGIANAKVGNFSEAVNCFEMALEAEPENATIWNDLGFVHRKLGNYRAAIESLTKALEIRPEYSTALDNLNKAKQEIAVSLKKRRRK